MKLPRFTVRKLMLITAMIAVGLFIAQEFWEGMPPRSVVQGIPARIARLKPGMTVRQVHDILGLEKSWLKGGKDAKFVLGEENGPLYHAVYYAHPASRVAGTANVKRITTSLGVYRGAGKRDRSNIGKVRGPADVPAILFWSGSWIPANYSRASRGTISRL